MAEHRWVVIPPPPRPKARPQVWSGGAPARCNRPPRGWICYLDRDHDGPCPAWPHLSWWRRALLRVAYPWR